MFLMYMKRMKVEGKTIVAVCDKELLGKIFEEGDRILDLDTNRGFYVGELSESAAILNSLSMADSVNLVGPSAVGLGLEAGLVKEENVIRVAGVPHAQAYRL